jgi:excisionase family DNA binding protein
VAKSKSGEFYTFDEVLRQLSIDENRLKRLVSEGEIRAFREGDQMKFKRTEIDNLAGRGGRGATSDTSLTDITIEEETTVRKGRETLTDDLLNEPDLTKRGGMKTAEISSQDTFIDQGGDVGMSTEPIDFTDDVGEEAEEVSDIGVTKVKRTTTTVARGPAPARTAVVLVEPRTSPLIVAALIITSLVAICAGFVVVSIARGRSTELSQFFSKAFYGDAYATRTPATPPPTNP